MNIAGHLRQIWVRLRALNDLLQPARVSLILSLLAPVLFLFIPQARDIVFALGEEHEFTHLMWFFIALIGFGLMNWYGPRFLFNCDFSAAGVAPRPPPTPGTLDHWLVFNVPRLLGTFPLLAIGYAFLSAAFDNRATVRAAPTNHLAIGLGCIATALILYAGFYARRQIILKRIRPHLVATTPQFKSIRHIVSDRWALSGLLVALAFTLILTGAFVVGPVPAGLAMGSGAVLLCVLASWACYGSILVYFGHRQGLPTLTLAALLAAFSSCFNDNHAIRTLDQREDPNARDPLVQRFEDWHKFVSANYPTGLDSKHPLFLVVTEGGGIRAGYWTARVLSTLEDLSDGRFSDHLFAISGVSGGSLGAATFNALLATPNHGKLAPQIPKILGQDFLAPLVGKMGFTDFAQRFIPHAFPLLDRAPALEDGWATQCDAFNQPFSQFYKPGRRLPELFFNGTEVEHGGRIITSTVRWEPDDFVKAIDGVERMDHSAMRLSTAVHASARFTYFSPAGRYPDGSHVVDGGYFENSGGNTAHDILNVVQRAAELHHWTDVRPIIIVITNGPEKPPRTDEQKREDAAKLRDNHGGSELLAPVLTLLNTRTAHADLSVGKLEAALPKPASASLKNDPNCLRFGLEDKGTVLPLGWTLSHRAMEEMNSQLDLAACQGLIAKIPAARARQ